MRFCTKLFLFQYLAFTFVVDAYSQQICGLVTDEENIPIANALVKILMPKDSTTIDYMITNVNGHFVAEVSKRDYLLNVMCLGYVPLFKECTFEEYVDTVHVVLRESSYQLDEVVVSSKYTGIQQGKDTITYNPKMFADGSESTLGDLLNKMPGIKVDSKGNIKAQGKDVQNLLVNGMDHFSGNIQLATKNLSADIADKIEVLNNYGEYSMLDGFKTSNKTVINIGVSKDKIGRLSGEISGGGGFDDKYASKINVMQIFPQFMLSYIGGINNNGDQLFDINNYFQMKGGMNEVFGKDGRFSLSDDEWKLLSPSDNNYKKTNGLGTINFSFKNKSIRLSSYLLYYDINSKTIEENMYSVFSGRDVWNYDETFKSKNRNELKNIIFQLSYDIDTLTSMSYKNVISQTDLNDDYNYALNYSNTVSADNKMHVSPFKTEHELLLMRKINKHVLGLNSKIYYDDATSELNIVSDSILFGVNIDNCVFQNKSDRRFESNNSISFLMNLSNSLYLKHELGYTYKKSSFGHSIYSAFSELNRERISSTINNYFANVEFVKNKGDFQYTFSLVANIYDYTSNFNHSTRFYLSPNIKFSFLFNSKNKLHLYINTDRIDNPISYFNKNSVVDSFKSVISKSRASKLFDKTFTISGVYSYFDGYSNFSLIANGSYQRQKDKLSQNIIQSDVVTHIEYINPVRDDKLFMSNVILEKGFDRIPFSFELSSYVNYYDYVNLLNNTSNNNKNFSFKCESILKSKFTGIVNFELSNTTSFNSFDSSVFGRFRQKVFDCGGKFMFRFSDRLYFDTKISYLQNYIPPQKDRMYLLNCLLKYTLSDKVSLSISGNNLLNLKNNNWNTTAFINNYEVRTNYGRLPGYLLFSSIVKI